MFAVARTEAVLKANFRNDIFRALAVTSHVGREDAFDGSPRRSRIVVSAGQRIAGRLPAAGSVANASQSVIPK